MRTTLLVLAGLVLAGPLALWFSACTMDDRAVGPAGPPGMPTVNGAGMPPPLPASVSNGTPTLRTFNPGTGRIRYDPTTNPPGTWQASEE